MSTSLISLGEENIDDWACYFWVEIEIFEAMDNFFVYLFLLEQRI